MIANALHERPDLLDGSVDVEGGPGQDAARIGDLTPEVDAIQHSAKSRP
jgi:hypothetical protein